MTRRDYVYKTKPYAHQERAFLLSRDAREYALLMDMGTGKSKVLIDTAAWLYQLGEIKAFVVLAPNGVHENWIDNEVPVHMPEWTQFRAAAWGSNMKAAQRRAFDALFEPGEGLRVLAMNVEAFGLGGVKGNAGRTLRSVLNSWPTLMAVDESTRIKTPGANRSKLVQTLGKHAKYRRIATGTVLVNKPFDVYAQFKFLGGHLLGFHDFSSFRSRYADFIMEERRDGKTYPVLVGYTRLEELTENIHKHSFRITKDECLDLPPKVFPPPRTYSMAPDQARIYRELRETSIATLPSGSETVAQNVLVRMLKLQQVLCGYVAVDADEPVESLFADPRANPRMKALLQAVEECSGKVIIWSRFVRDIETIAALLEEDYPGEGVVTYYGQTDRMARRAARERFQGVRTLRDADDKVIGTEPMPVAQQARFFVGQQHSGGIGLTLTAASTVIYYSNDFSYEARKQSEDRAHRIGQTKSVTYIDLQCPGTVDVRIVEALREKQELADIINRDNARQWL
jgi:SNF2 family DNA or RNA helicase